MKPHKLLFLAVIPVFVACNQAQINKICDPVLERKFNIVYNAHFTGELRLDNACTDTALVYVGVPEAQIVLPGSFQTFQVVREQQYLVVVDCSDTLLTYQFVNQCP